MLQNVLEVVSCTDTGAVRDFNEDSIATHTGLGLLVLADGMGGHNAGDQASRLAVATVVEEMKRRLPQLKAGDIDEASGYSVATVALKQALDRANLAIHAHAQSANRLKGMGTTIVVALFYNNRVTIAHLGDSRLYRLRARRLELLTRDHSLVQEQVAYGVIDAVDAKVSHNRNLVTRALGVDATAEFALREEPVLPNDIYLLSSDGLHDLMEEADIRLAVDGLKTNLQLAAQQLVEMANDNGGLDNISVILARVLRPFAAETAAPKGWLARILSWGR